MADGNQVEKNVPHSDIEADLDNNQIASAISLDEFMAVQNDNVEAREFILKEHEGLIPERSVDSLPDNQDLLKNLRMRLADLSGIDSLNPTEWNSGEGHILSSDYISEVNHLLDESAAVEMRELTGTDYVLDSGAGAKFTHDYLATQTSDVFYNLAHEDLDDGSLAYEIDVMALFDFPFDVDEYDIDETAVWRFTGITEESEKDSFGFAYSADPEEERQKARESFEDELFELMDEAGWFDKGMIWDSDSESVFNDVYGLQGRQGVSANRVHHDYPQKIDGQIRRNLYSLPDKPSQIVLDANGERMASGKEDILDYLDQEVFGHDPLTENVLMRELSIDEGFLADIKAGVVQIERYDIEEVKLRVPHSDPYRPVDDNIRTEDTIPEKSGGRPRYIHDIERDLQETYEVIFQK